MVSIIPIILGASGFCFFCIMDDITLESICAANANKGIIQVRLKSAKMLIENLGDSRYQFDVILLDLCIKDELNDDPTGYTFLPVLRQFFPLTPIIVYSSFTDMGHISRAFRDGATWYLRKENKHKLARHIVSIFSHPQWEREWSAIKENYSFKPEEEDQALDDIDKFLIASPIKNLPGNEIKWKQTTQTAFGVKS